MSKKVKKKYGTAKLTEATVLCCANEKMDELF